MLALASLFLNHEPSPSQPHHPGHGAVKFEANSELVATYLQRRVRYSLEHRQLLEKLMQNLETTQTAKEISIIDRARYIYGSDDINIPEDVQITVASHGYWVTAEVWVTED